MSSKFDSDDLPSYDSLVSPSQPFLYTNRPPRNTLQAHLSTLTSHISPSRSANISDIAAADQSTITTDLLPPLTSFLSAYTTTGLPRARLTLVPAKMVGANPTPADRDLHADDEFVRVERVEADAFWEDRQAARRLARGLRVMAGETPGVRFEVREEEVAFRTVTPFGLFATESGWGIVVRIRVDSS